MLDELNLLEEAKKRKRQEKLSKYLEIREILKYWTKRAYKTLERWEEKSDIGIFMIMERYSYDGRVAIYVQYKGGKSRPRWCSFHTETEQITCMDIARHIGIFTEFKILQNTFVKEDDRMIWCWFMPFPKSEEGKEESSSLETS